jgi:tetratricopeptide (TPR) repeat protein
MYCSNCGMEIELGDQFCRGCGNSLGETQKQPKDRSWLLLLFVAILVGGAVTSYYFYERSLNTKVEVMRKQAEELALAGKLEQASQLLNRAYKLRPYHQTIQLDRNLVAQGLEVEAQLRDAKVFLGKQEFSRAQTLLARAERIAQNGKGPFYEMLAQKVVGQRDLVTIAQLGQQVKTKKTIVDLASLLSRASALKHPQAKELCNQIRSKIANLAYSNASDFLKRNSFDEAIAAVDQGLEYDAGNRKLVTFKKTITDRRDAFLEEEEQRMEEAWLAAAQEEERNRIEAIELLSFDGSVDEDDDFLLEGQVRNIATRTVSSVWIYYQVLDADGDVVAEDQVRVSPYYLSPKEKGTFHDVQYGLTNGARVKIIRITWRLE